MANRVNKAFLESALKESVKSFSIKPGANLGDNVQGTLLAVAVTTDSGREYNLVYKYLCEDPLMSRFTREYKLFFLEKSVYEDLVPCVNTLLASRGDNEELPTPKYYGGLYDGDNDYLLMEDVRPLGYKMPDKFRGLNLPEVKLILQKTAKWHASTYFLLRQEGEKWFEEGNGHALAENTLSKMNSTPEGRAVGEQMFKGCLENSITLLKSRVSSQLHEKMVSLAASSSIEKIIKLSQATDTKYFPCIIHGDLWGNNIMIKYENGDFNRPVDLKFLDFQLTRRSNVIDELQYFLLCSTTPAFRQLHLAEVLHEYYEAFTATLSKINCPLPIGFTRGFFIDGFYDSLLPGFIYQTFAIPMQLAEPIDFSAMMPKDKEEEKPGLPPPDNPIEQLKMRNQMLFMQMMNSPKALARLEEMTVEMDRLNLLG